MVWIKALNGNVVDVPKEFVDGLVAQGHEAFDTEDEARGKQKRAAKSDAPKSKPATAPAKK